MFVKYFDLKYFMVCFFSVKRIPHPIPPADKPDPKAAQALQEGLGGQFGEMRTMMQYFFQNMNFRVMPNPIKIY